MALPPTSANLLQHMLGAHLQIMLWKAADCEGTAGESKDITNCRWKFRIKIYIPVIAEGNPAPPELLDLIQCRARGVLRRYVDATSSTPFCNCHGGQDCLNPFTATWEISKSSEEDTVKKITLTATLQMILVMLLNKTMRMEMFLTTQFRTIWMRVNKDKEIKETLYFIFCLFCRSFSPIHLSYYLIETHITYHTTYDNQLNSQFSWCRLAAIFDMSIMEH